MTATFFPIITSNDPPKAPSGWEWRLLGEVAQLRSGHTPSRREEDYWNGGDIPWLSLKDIKGLEGRYVLDTENKPTQKGIDNTSAPILPKGTVAFCRTASVGKVVILGRDMATSQDFANWVCGDELLPEYLYEALHASGGQFNKEKQGSTHKTIYMPTLERFRVLLPPLPEQRRIADILDRADAIRRKRREAINLTEELVRVAFLDMFGDPVTNLKGWKVKPLGSVCEVAGGLQVTHAREGNPIALPYLRVANVFRDRLELSEVKEIRVTPAEAERAALKVGDVLVVEGHGNPDELGRAAVWSGEIPNCTNQNHLIRVRPKQNVLESIFLSAYLNSGAGRAQMLRLGKTTSGLNTISTNNVRSVSVLVPPLPLQRTFGRLVLGKQRLLAGMVSSAAAAEELFDSLAHRAFRGELTTANGATKPQLGLFDAGGR